MRKERYELSIDTDVMKFRFTSVGPKGEVSKLVIYSKMPIRNFYNLAFGDKALNIDTIDDFVVTDNKDSQKVLATVAFTVYAFTNQYPDAVVFAKGSSIARTRLYQIGISNNLDEITTDFTVLGERNGKWQIFERNVGYDAFLITRKENSI